MNEYEMYRVKPIIAELIKSTDPDDADRAADAIDRFCQETAYPPADNFKTVFLCLSVHHRNTRLTRILVEDKGYDIQHPIRPFMPMPLHVAVCNNDIDMVEYLCEQGANIWQVAIGECYFGTNLLPPSIGQGVSAVGLAIRLEYLDIVDVLLKHETQRKKDAFPNNLLFVTLQEGSWRFFELLTSGEKYPISTEQITRGLSFAIIYRRDIKFISRLIQLGANVNETEFSHQGKSPLHLTVTGYQKSGKRAGLLWEQAPAVLKLLLDSGADVNKYCDSSGTPVATLMFQIGASVRTRTDLGSLDCDTQIPLVKETLKLLLDHGADLNYHPNAARSLTEVLILQFVGIYDKLNGFTRIDPDNVSGPVCTFVDNLELALWVLRTLLERGLHVNPVLKSSCHTEKLISKTLTYLSYKMLNWDSFDAAFRDKLSSSIEDLLILLIGYGAPVDDIDTTETPHVPLLSLRSWLRLMPADQIFPSVLHIVCNHCASTTSRQQLCDALLHSGRFGLLPGAANEEDVQIMTFYAKEILPLKRLCRICINMTLIGNGRAVQQCAPKLGLPATLENYLLRLQDNA